jgi:hypothetical protein
MLVNMQLEKKRDLYIRIITKENNTFYGELCMIFEDNSICVRKPDNEIVIIEPQNIAYVIVKETSKNE